jgi:hypothetical protein
MSNVGYIIDQSARPSRCECGDACEDVNSPGYCAKGQLRFSSYSTSSLSRPRKYSWHLGCVTLSQVRDVCYTYGGARASDVAKFSDTQIVKAIRKIERFDELDEETRRHVEEFLLALARTRAERLDLALRWIDSVFLAPATPPQEKTKRGRPRSGGRKHPPSKSSASSRDTSLRKIVQGAIEKPSSSGRKRIAAPKIREEDEDKEKDIKNSSPRERNRRQRTYARRSSMGSL